MKLPYLERAVVEEKKLIGYLLLDENSDGKAGFFKRFGFTQDDWEIMQEALLKHANDMRLFAIFQIHTV
jgi:hypothetical protein